MYSKSSLLTLFLACSLASMLYGQSGSGQLGQTHVVTPLPVPALAMPDNIQPDLITPAAPDSYIIGDNDLLTVFVYEMPELTRQVRVDNHGTIRLPFIARSFTAAGKTAPMLQKEIAHVLLLEQLARAPMVQVVVRQVESKPIIVTGAVKHPLTLQAARPMRLLEVLARAGGLSGMSGDSVLVTSHDANSGFAAASYNLNRLIRYADPSDNPWLTGNQTVTVLPARLIYVVGAFRRPGAFPLRTGHPISILKAIALAQGLKGAPDKSAAEIIRTMPDNTQKIISVHINRILKHQAPDLKLSAGNILYVPQDRKHILLMTALQDAGQAAVIALGYHL